MGAPTIILLFSGKRKSGKDYICEKIKSHFGVEKCTVVRISGPLKGLYAKNHNLDFQELLSDGPYKENYRADMIRWSDKIREKEPGYFCKAACDEADLAPVWIVSDIRRKTDVQWFKNTRKNRGWIFTEGVDDVDSECNLDDFSDWDLQIKNSNETELQSGLHKITTLVNSVLM
ncbi:phosphomevalonate kinase-like isoform X2 [Zophobas morio]|uniref:phosphomevalonate kinase-like isoform X2 n=1 Tax=Zophobas morio TaxID=2755281 RepID=UPI00308332FA